MTIEELIITLLISKQSIAELFNNNNNNNNLYDNEISDTRRILSRLRDILPKKGRQELEISFMKQNVKEIFQKKKKKEMMNILENW